MLLSNDMYHTNYPPPYRLPAMIVITAAVEGRYVCTYILIFICHIPLSQMRHSYLLLYILTIPIG